MKKYALSICTHRYTNQFCSNCTDDQCLCFHSTDSTIPLLNKSEISSFYLSSVSVQANFYRS